jgi:Sulfate permease family
MYTEDFNSGHLFLSKISLFSTEKIRSNAYIAGMFQIVMGLARMGNLIKFIPWPVTSGFTTGIAVSIIATGVPDLLGIHAAGPAPREFLAKVEIIQRIKEQLNKLQQSGAIQGEDVAFVAKIVDTYDLLGAEVKKLMPFRVLFRVEDKPTSMCMTPRGRRPGKTSKKSLALMIE